jgi:hypothetical protein
MAETYPKELLGSRNNVSNDDRCAEGIDDVLVVRVEDESAHNLAYSMIIVEFED